MKLVRYRLADGDVRSGVVTEGGELRVLDVDGLYVLASVPKAQLREFIQNRMGAVVVDEVVREAPIDGETEVWASGVTYLRSRQARQEESSTADVYSLVYDAERPELFLKSNARRVVGPDAAVGIREDSTLNVPEPELALFTNAFGEIIAAGICNDVSSRSIEGANPLYLPQAKIYAGSCSLGDGWVLVEDIEWLRSLAIEIDVRRGDRSVWNAATNTSSMHRSLEDLVSWLHVADWFPHGAVLSTGTGLVPDLSFTLEADDVVTITIEDVGRLSNRIAVGRNAFRDLPRVLDYESGRAST